MKKFFLRLWWCKIWNWHKWTSAVQQGIKPTEEQLTSLEGFWDYAKMYCERCGHVSELSKKNILTETYQIVLSRDQIGIKCLVCGRISYNMNDINYKYCGNCHRFHLDYNAIRSKV